MAQFIHVRHILVKHRFEAEDLLKKLSSGTPFAQLAEKFSFCSSAKNGGDLGKVSTQRLDPDFLEGVESLKLNEISNPIRTKFGYHIVERLG